MILPVIIDVDGIKQAAVIQTIVHTETEVSGIAAHADHYRAIFSRAFDIKPIKNKIDKFFIEEHNKSIRTIRQYTTFEQRIAYLKAGVSMWNIFPKKDVRYTENTKLTVKEIFVKGTPRILPYNRNKPIEITLLHADNDCSYLVEVETETARMEMAKKAGTPYVPIITLSHEELISRFNFEGEIPS